MRNLFILAAARDADNRAGTVDLIWVESAALGAWRRDAEQSHKEYSFGADTWEPA